MTKKEIKEIIDALPDDDTEHIFMFYPREKIKEYFEKPTEEFKDFVVYYMETADFLFQDSAYIKQLNQEQNA